MIKKEIKRSINKALQEAKITFLPLEIETSKFGDYSTNIALRIHSFDNYQTALEVANYLVARIEKNPLLSKMTVSQPGFINFTINQKEAAKYLPRIAEDPQRYLSTKTNKNKFARVEFISANPTGPLHIGNARGGPLGDSIASVLKASGYKVLREYYNNDIGTQVDIFSESLIGLLKLKIDPKASIEKLPESYQGEYLQELAETIIQKLNLKQIKDIQKNSEVIKNLALRLLIEEILDISKEMGIEFDEIYNESRFQKEGLTQKVIERLNDKGVTKTKDGALWFAPKSDFLEDRESVLIRADGRPTYFADDIAYHELKFKSQPDLVLNILGSNHHGHVPRIQATVAALGYDVNKLKVVLYQYVRVKRGKIIVKMSKRAGNFVTAEEVLKEVGKDAFRFLLLQHSPNSHLDFDLELAKKQSNENPVYYVQYAHARMSSILAKAPENTEKFYPELLKTETEASLTRKILELPSLIDEVAESFAVHKLVFYCIELAEHFHKFYESCQVISSDQKLTYARLQLVQAAKVTLAVSLSLLGVSAPEKM